MKEVFPWFDVSNPSATYEPQTLEDSTVKIPYSDHPYADSELIHHKPKQISKKSAPGWKLGLKRPDLTLDSRKCTLCLKTGDGDKMLEGRLLYYRHNDWVHINCALWSSEVYEEVDGSLQNAGQALNRGPKLNCTVCGGRGATIGCCHRDCKYNYHLACGVEDGAAFKVRSYCIQKVP